MKLIFLYGPPAAGKLTVANEFARITGFKVFHNHLTVDLVVELFDFGTEPFLRLLRDLRLRTIAIAAEESLAGMVMTFVYKPPLSDPYIEEMVDLCRQKGIEEGFVHLFCDQKTLEERVLMPSRAAHRKLNTVEGLKSAGFTKEAPAVSIPFVKSLSIDNSTLPPHEAARRIAEHFRVTWPA